MFWYAYKSCPVTAKKPKLRTNLSNHCMISGKGKRFFSPCVRPGSGTRWVPGVHFLKVKKPQREASHSAPINTVVKNVCSYTYRLFGCLHVVQKQQKVLHNCSREYLRPATLQIDLSSPKIQKKKCFKNDETVFLIS